MNDRPVTPVKLELLGDAIMSAAERAGIGVSVTWVDEPRVAFVNDAGVRILGWSREEIAGMSAMDLLSPEDQARALERRERRARGEPVPNWVEHTAIAKDGRRVAIQVGLSVIQIEGRTAAVAFMLDVSERRGAIEALARSEARFKQLIELAPDAIWVFDGKRLVFVNPAAVEMLGYPDADTLRQTNPLDMVHPEERLEIVERTKQMLATGRSLEPRDYRTFRRDGRLIIVEVQSMPIEWEGRPALLSFGRDVTARKEIEARLVQADRLAALGTLVAGIAHEINNPLTLCLLGIEQASGLLPSLSGPGDAREQLGDRLEELRLGVERISAIVRELRPFVRGGDEAHAAVQLSEVVLSAARFVQNEIRHRARLTTEFAEVPPVNGNTRRLEQVFLNLLVNAAHALPEDRIADNEIRVRVHGGAGGQVLAEVSDNGAGIAEADLPRIFDPFFTTKSHSKGMGLGLSICQSIVVSHGGTLKVESERGRGTTFRVALPAAPMGAAAPPPVGAIPVVAAAAPLNLLIVDDEPAVGAAIARLLEPRYRCRVASSGPTALDYLQRQEFDLVVCDLMMPGMTGMEVHEQATQRRPELAGRFVFMTGGAFTRSAADFAARCRSPVLEKPFGIAALEETLARLSRRE